MSYTAQHDTIRSSLGLDAEHELGTSAVAVERNGRASW